MPVGVGPLYSRPLATWARRLHIRFFGSSSIRPSNEGYHTYFRHDSPIVHFPPGSRMVQPQHQSFGLSRKNISGELPNRQFWMIFLGGFITSPILWLGYICADWAFGSKLWKADIEELERVGMAQGSRGLRGPPDGQFMDSNNLYRILQRANAETKALHDLILLWIDPRHGLHAVKDTQLLKKHPIRMSTGKQLDPNQAILIRIIDKNSKTLVLLLGVDMKGHVSPESDPGTAWCQDDALKKWMDERSKDLKRSSEASEQGISLYCYTGTSSATSLSGKKGEMWQEARLFPEDLPERFPLSALESVKDELRSDAS